jgi:hypothetical protein
MSDHLFSHFYSGPFGPYGTNVGDIWSGEDSDVGERLKREKGLILIHEVMEKDGKVQDCVYSVDENNPDMEMQMLIKRARDGLKKWIAAQGMNN